MKILDDVKMVWFESMEFNYSQTENIQFIPNEKYKIEYDFTTFVEKKDKSIWACGMNVFGADSEIRKIDAYGEVLCSPSFVHVNIEEQTMQELEEEERKTEGKERPSKEMVLYMRSAVTEGILQLAKDTHDVEYMIKVYRILHDMDYFLFRYGIEDVGRYVKDISTISKYYGVLDVYE